MLDCKTGKRSQPGIKKLNTFTHPLFFNNFNLIIVQLKEPRKEKRWIYTVALPSEHITVLREWVRPKIPKEEGVE